MKKRAIIIASLALIVLVGAFYFFGTNSSSPKQEQTVLAQTLSASTDYVFLRQQTENVLEDANSFDGYDSWSQKVNEVIDGWKSLEQLSSDLEKTANEMASQKVGLKLFPSAHAYDKQEINKIIDSAPMGKKIMTLAKHLGTDAKHAQLILNQTQDEISREAYGEEGDVFEKCEQNSMRIKNGAKVAGYVGGVVLTGGASAVVASGALATTATVVVGADLVLEITDDEARIALGDKNKVSEMVSSVRTVSEPAAAILSITNIPGNLSKGIDRLSALSFGADQVRSVIQDEKILGISIKTDEQGSTKGEIAGLNEDELPKWREENNAPKSDQPVEEIVNNAKEIAQAVVANKDNEPENTDEKNVGQTAQNKDALNQNQIYKVVNVSNDSFMMDACLSASCWDDLAANPAEDRDLGGIYTMGKVFGNMESFRSGFRPSDVLKSGKLVETSPNSYKITIYFAIAPFEGPKHKTINYGTWLSTSIEINANYGDEPVIEWDGNSLRQAK